MPARPWTFSASFRGVLTQPEGSLVDAADSKVVFGRNASVNYDTGGEPVVMLSRTIEMAASATVNLDLQAFTTSGVLTPDEGAVYVLTEVFGIILKAGANGGLVTIIPHATNGWTALLGPDGLKALSTGEVFACCGATFAVSPTSKVLSFTNGDGTNPATVEVCLLGSE
jgi:hypothetical protein